MARNRGDCCEVVAEEMPAAAATPDRLWCRGSRPHRRRYDFPRPTPGLLTTPGLGDAELPGKPQHLVAAEAVDARDCPVAAMLRRICLPGRGRAVRVRATGNRVLVSADRLAASNRAKISRASVTTWPRQSCSARQQSPCPVRGRRAGSASRPAVSSGPTRAINSANDAPVDVARTAPRLSQVMPAKVGPTCGLAGRVEDSGTGWQGQGGGSGHQQQGTATRRVPR